MRLHCWLKLKRHEWRNFKVRHYDRSKQHRICNRCLRCVRMSDLGAWKRVTPTKEIADAIVNAEGGLCDI